MCKNCVLFKRLRNLGTDQSGAIAVIAAIVITMLMGFVALALDIGHIVSAQSELQKAADAGALAGARALNLVTPFPNWANGQNVATATVNNNKLDGTLLTNCTVQTGYWDLKWNASTAPTDLKSIGIIPGATDMVAVKVTLSKSTGNNGGPLTMFFARVLGINTANLNAKSVATMVPQLPVSTIPAGDAFPLATPITWVNQMWSPDHDSASFRIGSDYHSIDGGQWTSFLLDANDVSTIRQLIATGNPGPLSIGDNIWIEPGTKDSLFADAANLIGQTVLLPVVKDHYDTHNDTPLLAFVPFYIEDAKGANDKYVQGHFVHNYKAPAATGSSNAPNYGAIGFNVKLVQ